MRRLKLLRSDGHNNLVAGVLNHFFLLAVAVTKELSATTKAVLDQVCWSAKNECKGQHKILLKVPASAFYYYESFKTLS